MTKYLYNIRALANDLIRLGSQITDREVTGYVLDGLPHDFQLFTTTINDQHNLNFDDVYHLLISKDLMIKRRNAKASLVFAGSSNIRLCCTIIQVQGKEIYEESCWRWEIPGICWLFRKWWSIQRICLLYMVVVTR